MDYNETVAKLRADYSPHIDRIEKLTMGLPSESTEELMTVISEMVGSRETERAKYHHKKWLEHSSIVEKIVRIPVTDCGGIEKSIEKVFRHGNMNDIAVVLRNCMEAVVHHHLERYSEQ